MKKGQFKRIAVNAAAGGLALCLLLALIADVRTASAVTSLPHIESIVHSLESGSTSFQILEIVPEENSGSIGYYAAGQEPTAYWAEELPRKTNQAARAAYMDALLGSLRNKGLLAAGDAAPLLDKGNYNELLPWETRSSGVTYSALKLDHSETTENVQGAFVEKKSDGDDFDYRAETTFTIRPDQKGGYLQNIDYFRPCGIGEVAAGTNFYYQPTFAKLDMTAAEAWPDQNVAIYTWVTNAENPELGHYEYYDQLSNGLERGYDYYYVTATGVPSSALAEGATAETAPNTNTGWYAAPLDQITPYQKAEGKGWFDLTTIGFVYVGSGKGDYRYTATNEGSWRVTTDTVFYSGGYANNNWFLKKTMDVSAEKAASLRVSVTSVPASKLDDALVEKIKALKFGLVVLSGGFRLNGTSPTAYSASGNDLSQKAYEALLTATNEENRTPIVVDSNLISQTGTEIGQLAALLKGTSTLGTFVRQNVYVAKAPLATQGLDTPFQKDLYGTPGAAFYDVYAEILHENALRRLPDAATTDLLREDVSMASAIRYIINYANQRVVTAKDQFTVLDIEPAKDTKLTKNTVLSWFPDGKYTRDDVSIVTMSTAEFIGKIEDVSENYDVVYLGSHCAFSLNNHNDEHLDGLVYTNIGDWYRGGYNLSGLLDRDYYQGDPDSGYIDATASSKANLYRFSGNDLTAVKVQKLKDFASTGYPIILADDLLTDTGKDAETFTLNAKIEEIDNKQLQVTYQLTSNVDGRKVSPARTFQWYRDGEAISGETGKTCSASQSGIYTCKVTASYEGKSATATSNALEVSLNAAGFTAEESTGGQYGSYSYEYSIKITGKHQNKNFDIYTIEGAPGNAKYEWHQMWYDGWRGWQDTVLSGESEVNLRVGSTTNKYYYCVVTFPDASKTELTSKYAYWNGNEIYYSGNQTTEKKGTKYYSVSIAFDDASDTFTASALGVDGYEINYEWYRYFGAFLKTNASYTLSANTDISGYYYCKATVVDTDYVKHGNSASSEYWNVTKASGNWQVIDVAPAQPATLSVPAVVGSRSVNDKIVDSASQVYALLDAIKDRSNVKRETAAKTHQETVYAALNLSKPEIKFQGNQYPTPYEKAENGTVTGKLESENGKYYLSYSFQILNATDPTPQTTTYEVSLFLDQDGDGNYTQSEMLADILCKDASGNNIELTELKGGTDEKNAPVYTVKRQMPSTAVGILPWKLQVTKTGTGNSYIHASTHNYTYIQPPEGQAKSINILQINSTTHDDNGYNLEEQMETVGYGGYQSETTKKSYRGIYGKLLADVSQDFDVQITTILSSDFRKYNSYEDLGENVRQALPADYTLNNENFLKFRTSLLEQFDMVIIGFDDVYRDLDTTSAQAVVNYIESGRSILFAHDTTSFCNAKHNQQVSVSSDYWNTNEGWNGNVNTTNEQRDLTIASLDGYETVKKERQWLDKGTYRLTVDVTATPATQISVKRSDNWWGKRPSFSPLFGTEANDDKEVFKKPSGTGRETITLDFQVTSAGDANILVWNSGSTPINNISLKNFTLTKLETSGISGYDSWGYDFNRLLRSAVSLDRYGVLDHAGDEKAYTTAYVPGTTEKAPEIQGFTNYELLRYGSGNGSIYGSGKLDDEARLTEKVSQVNEGQITTYPFNINTEYFKNNRVGRNTLPVALTHEQYYQLNLNADDIVVWYCLADDDGTSGNYYNVSPNDVTNNYYIYSVGNVTYTGAGHSYTQSAINGNETEAKLFVNTMIAAYRTARTKPSVQVVASPGDPTAITNYYLTADYEGSGYASTLAETSEECPIYVVVTDTNLESDRTIQVDLTYKIAGTERSYNSTLPIYRASSGGQVYTQNVNGSSNLISGMVYYFNLPPDVLQAFGDARTESEMKLNVSVSTTFSDEQKQDCTTPYQLTLHKVGLLDLS